ncbi:MAG TPA: cytochrome b/b6 domain-containing protein [Croceibacterium sp.]|nr:cytochrome b/b6 domain-containing protein [Croceibacterium sp.]
MKRHALSTRIWHWVNALSLIVLFMSGLNISNAHPHLYWGEWGFMPRDAWLHVIRFPGWATIPGYYSLASARDWHVLFAWVFGLALLLFLLAALLNGHLRRDIATRWRDWRPAAIAADIRAHLRFEFDHGDGRYNFLQKAAYGLVLFVLLPLMIVSGMAISPGMDAAWPFLTDLFAGRQSARSVHFIVAWALFAFFVLHVGLVLLNKPARHVRDMITGGSRDAAA